MSEMNTSDHTNKLEIQVPVPIAKCLKQPPLMAKINKHQDVPNLVNSKFLQGTTDKEKLPTGESQEIICGYCTLIQSLIFICYLA